MTTRSRAPQIRMMALASTLMAATALAAPAMAQSAPAPHMIQAEPSISLSAYGEVKVAPDMATITFGVVTEAPTAAEAMAQNAARMTQVIAALRRAGISERDIQTSGLNLSAQYDYVQNEPPRLRGYQASNRVTVVINDVNAVGTTADAVVAAGVNQIDGITFGLKNSKAAQHQRDGLVRVQFGLVRIRQLFERRARPVQHDLPPMLGHPPLQHGPLHARLLVIVEFIGDALLAQPHPSLLHRFAVGDAVENGSHSSSQIFGFEPRF